MDRARRKAYTKTTNPCKKPTASASDVERLVSLRDYFATCAMNGIIIGNKASFTTTSKDGSLGTAEDAYNIADAMLKKRKEKAS